MKKCHLEASLNIVGLGNDATIFVFGSYFKSFPSIKTENSNDVLKI